MKEIDSKLLARILSVPKNIIKGEGGAVRTKSLFNDVIMEDSPYKCIYYLRREQSDDDYIALKEVYMAMEDPTEFYFATLCFYNYAQWETISKLAWAKDVVDQWRKELALKLRSQAVHSIYEMTLDSSGTKETSKLNALKWLADNGYVHKDTTKTSKAKSEKKSEDVTDNLVVFDAERLGLKVIK